MPALEVTRVLRDGQSPPGDLAPRLADAAASTFGGRLRADCGRIA